MEDAAHYHMLAVHAAGDYGKLKHELNGAPNWREACKRTLGPACGRAIADYHELQERGIRVLLAEDPGFPQELREIPHPPFALYIRGILPDPKTARLAIVGTRRATPDGKTTARRFSAALARAGAAVVSGLAFGIDAAAHEGCLDADGTTIAVLPGGLNEIYPRNNARIAERILGAGGAIVSEYPPGEPAYPARFLERNRIVSGLSRGVLVIEAPERSGSLATARFAIEQNRDVFVVPGPVTHPHFRGSHGLIRDGAELVRGPEDIFIAYGMAPADRLQTAAGDPETRAIIACLASFGTPGDIDKIAAATKLEPRIVSRITSMLLIQGVLREDGAGFMIN